MRRRRGALALLGAGLLLLVGLVTAALLSVPRAGWTTNEAVTGECPGYKDLIPHRYDMPVEDTTRFAAEAARRLPHWNVVRTDPAKGSVTAEVQRPFPLFTFTDDVTVTVVPDERASVVKIRSEGRSGFGGDLGANASHIRALQAAMDARLPPAP